MQVYIHLTDMDGAKGISSSGKLWASSIVEGVYAIAKGSTFVPGVQMTRLGRAKSRLVAVYFTTPEIPDYCTPEECVWRQKEIPVKVLKVVSALQARKDLDGSIPTLNPDKWNERLLIPSKEIPDPSNPPDFLMNESLGNLIYEIVDEAIPEPKRIGAPSTHDLGIQPDAGYENIMRVLKSATPAEVDYWGKWYYNAKSDVQELATKYNIPFPIMAAVVAVLSPGNKWHMNLMAAEKVLQNAPKINAYGNNIAKARKILETGETKWVTGPKVTVFLNSLLDPDSVKDDLVLDGHAINIWRGKKTPLQGLAMPSKKARQIMVNDYKKAAQDFGVPVQAVQAITWYIWKYTMDPPPPVKMKFNLLPSSLKEAMIEEDLDEVAKNLSNLSNEGLGLFFSENDRGSMRRFVLVDLKALEEYILVKPQNNAAEINAARRRMVVGTIKYFQEDNDSWSIGTSAAERGYGPIMYEVAMSSIHPNWLGPDAQVSESAQKVWYKFYQRSDIEHHRAEDRTKNWTPERLTDPLFQEYRMKSPINYKAAIINNHPIISKLEDAIKAKAEKFFDLISKTYFSLKYEP